MLLTLQQSIIIPKSPFTNMTHVHKFMSQLARTAAALERSNVPIHLGLTVLQSGVVQSRDIAANETIIAPTLTSFCSFEKSTLNIHMHHYTHTYAHTHCVQVPWTSP